LFRNVTAVATLVLTGACSVLGGPAAPEPSYTVVRAEDPFEIRDYPELVIVSTAMTADSGAAFGKLFDYISGANQGSRKISMTAPVLQARKGDKVEMTAPVIQGRIGDAESRRMAFVLPENFTVETAPLPIDPSVSLSTIPPRRIAVVRFSGRLSDEAAEAQRVKLTGWMSEQQIEAVGPAESAGYNPPWTLPPLRRNEVFIPINAQ
jgi:hypothetical protein